MGSVPVITWEPWLTDFDAAQHPDLPDLASRDKGGLADIAAGKYDFYIGRWADGARSVHSQIFLRVAHEMNDPQHYPWETQNNTAKDFVAAWRHIRDVFRRHSVTNVIWVWSPHPAYGYFDAYYPGDDQVDYIGSSCLNYGAVASWSRWWTFQDIFGRHYKELEHFRKPIMITEFGSLGVGGSRSTWYADALDQVPQRFPAVKAIIFFHYSDDKTTVQQGLNWYIRNDVPVVHSIVTTIEHWSK